MLKSTLLDIIRSFSKEELNKFDDFVKSPYFNKKDSVVSLFLEIKKYYPEFTGEELKRESVWKKLFPGKNFNYGIMKNLIYDLVKLGEKFITLELYNKNELRILQDLTEALDNRNITKILSTKLLSFEKNFTIDKVKNLNIANEDYYFMLSKIYWLKIFNNSSNTLDSGFEKERNIGSEYMVYSFLIYLFKLYDNLRVLKYNDSKTDNPDIVDLLLELIDKEGLSKILDYAKTGSENNFKILNCYYAMYKAVSAFDNTDFYFNFKSSLSEISNLITENDFRYLCVNLSNSLVNLKSFQINKEKEFRDVYNMMISNNIFTESSGILKDNIFINYIINQSALLNSDEMENFINEFIGKIPAERRENSYNFAMAHLNFTRCDFRKSLEYVSKINIVYFDMKYYVKNLQMMIYYELDDYEAFVFAFDSYKHFTSNNKNILETWKVKTSSFYNTVKILFKLRNNFDEYKLTKLKKEITESFPSRKLWLLKKLEELELNNNLKNN
jgi:hypothetical protein